MGGIQDAGGPIEAIRQGGAPMRVQVIKVPPLVGRILQMVLSIWAKR